MLTIIQTVQAEHSETVLIEFKFMERFLKLG